jgi:hypothetical protein
MQSIDITRPGMPDLQFVLMVAALCTSDLPTLNVPEDLRRTVFDRCWALISSNPPPTNPKERVLDLRSGTDLTLEALVATIREIFLAAGITTLTWEHPPSEPTRSSTPEALPLIERLQQLFPNSPDDPQSPRKK